MRTEGRGGGVKVGRRLDGSGLVRFGHFFGVFFFGSFARGLFWGRGYAYAIYERRAFVLLYIRYIRSDK